MWQAQSVVPSVLGLAGHDGSTGLDLVYVGSTAPWGVTADGTPYFDPDGGSRAGERQRLIAVGGSVYLTNDY
jgi:hypothetical protein